MACIVTSKVLGIGDAERAWKVAKKIKSGQRANIGADKLMKQTTLHASACIEMAKIRHREKVDSGVMWTDEDFAFARDIGEDQMPTSKLCLSLLCFDNSVAHSLPSLTDNTAVTVRRMFHGYVEDWEVAGHKKKDDVVVRERYAAKYKDLIWYDPDDTDEEKMKCIYKDMQYIAGQNGG